MIRQVLSTVAEMFLEARSESLKGHPLADYIRNEGPRLITESLGNPYFDIVGSPGQGNWAEVPWFCVFDPVITTSATRGYYVVYLFSVDMQRVYLALGQGTTVVREEFGARTHDELKRRASLMRDRLADRSLRFTADEVDLGGTTTLARDYVPAVGLHVVYELARLPGEETLQADLKEATSLYLRLTSRGGLSTFEDVDRDESATQDPQSILERRRYRKHRKIERNSKAAESAKKVHGCTCQACGFNFEAIYGPLGAGYIEAHHLVPLSELPEDAVVSLDPRADFAVLCANCHRMIHRRDAPKELSDFRATIRRP